MKYFTFHRDNNKFDDILDDVSIKKFIDVKISWYQHLMVGISDTNDQTLSLLTLKYGDDMIPYPFKDYSPVPGVDYIPEKDASKYKKVID